MSESFNWKLPFILLFAVIALLAGMLGGLFRMGMVLPPVFGNLAVNHGELMVGGFLGTLITLERAVAIEKLWGYLAPVLAGIASVLLWTGLSAYTGMLLIIASSILLVVMYGYLLSIQPSLHSIVMAIGGILWLAGNIFWVYRVPFAFIADFWAGFLILTIVGERIELSRMVLQDHLPRILILVITGFYTAGLFVSLLNLYIGVYIFALSLIAMSFWLFKYDMARITIKTEGLPKFIAICLLTGYFWLSVSGVFTIVYLYYPVHLMYDAMLHSIFLGFVMSMIFAHAPVIFSSIIGIDIGFNQWFYSHYWLLHLSLVIRIIGDIFERPDIRLLGGTLNVIAILLFLFNTIIAIIGSVRKGSAAHSKILDQL